MSTTPKRYNPDAAPEVQVDTGIVAIHDLRNHTRIFGFKFLIFAALFYISVPIFYYWLSLNWTFVDSIYFCVVTFGTVGFGDIVPTTVSQRMLTSIFILIGIGVTGNVFGVVAAIRSERVKRDEFLISKLETAKQVATARKLRNSRQSVVIKMSKNSAFARTVAAFANVFRELFDKVTMYDEMVLKRMKRDQESNNERNRIAQLRLKYLKELQDMRWNVFLKFMMLWTVLIFGMLVMMGFENWSSEIAFYWAVVTISTVGFGDYVPTTQGAKLFTSFYIVVGAVILLNALASLVWTPIQMLAKKNEIEVIKQFESDMKEEQFNGIVAHPLFQRIPRLRSEESRITKSEFVLTMLNLMNKVNDQDIVMAADIFEKFDDRGLGYLSAAVVQEHLKDARERDEQRLPSDGAGAEVVAEANAPFINMIRSVLGGDNKSSQDEDGLMMNDGNARTSAGNNLRSNNIPPVTAGPGEPDL